MPKPTSGRRATERNHLWPMVRLGDVCGTINGIWKGLRKPFVHVGIIRSSNMTKNCEFSLAKTIYIDVEEKKYKQRKLLAGDIIVERSGGGPGQPVGRAVYFDLSDGEYSISNFTSILRVKDANALNGKFLQLYLTSQYFQGATENIQSNTTGLHNLDFDAYLNFKIPLPPLSVQREIVARLERKLAAVEKMKKGFETLAETAKAEFKAERLEAHKELLNGEWPCEPLKKHVDVLAGYAFKSQGFVDSGIRICGGLIIAPDRIKWEECKYWNFSDGIEQYLLQENDLVIALDRPWISGGFKIGVIGRQNLPCLLIQRTARLRMKDVDFRYVMMLLRDESFKLHCTTSGTTVPHISHKDIETYEIPFPPAKVQKEIVARLSAAKTRAEKLEAKAREGVAVCETMRKAILKEAFE